MAKATEKQLGVFGWGVIASVLLHIVVVAGFLIKLPQPAPPPQEETVNIEMVPPPEEQKPEEKKPEEQAALKVPEEPKPEFDVKPENIRPAATKKTTARVKLAVVADKAEPVAKTKTVAAAKPAARGKKADDLKQISGIGPKLEQVLNAKGVRMLSEIAGWSDADVARLDAEFGFDGRIVRDGWVAQAKALTAKGRKRT